MSLIEQSQSSVEDEPFSLTVDQYGRLWLQAKMDGLPIAIDLAEKGVAFNIMAASMSENDFEYRPIPQYEEADNDDQKLA